MTASSDGHPWAAPASGHRPVVRSLGSLVYDGIKQRLLEGAVPAGTRLRVDELKAAFGVSKQPVMEALRRLSTEGLVEIIPQVGCQVCSYPQREVEDFFQLFAGMEGTITEIAAARRTDAQLARLAEVEGRIDALREAADSTRRSQGYRAHNRTFHAVIHEMAGSPILAATSQRMWDLSDFLINTNGAITPLSTALDQRHADHERIIDALRERDGPAAREATQAHIVGTLEIIWDGTAAGAEGHGT
ncbi:GntR family transcriptional regulator [Pseudonocardia sp. WMMC193]|uniref:GntR family transcriptional regulator n=1 Tax=Pseudonocardia sp. WMMC193 TaxID=2911965 RepID=UPI001F1D8DA8|nr:GntR family transcriptional regulator [Pseudonocardia sp. WMMC193]MCF7550831.1 GntR family transcriptional regulator [Pseudonocardia sp. WMMC193]